MPFKKKPGTKPKRMRVSDERLRRFATAYLRYGNGRIAYLKSGMRGALHPSDKTARTEAYKMMHDERMGPIMERLRERVAEKSITSLAQWLAGELRLARFDPARLFDDEGHLLPIHEIDPDTRAAIQSIEVSEEKIETPTENGVEIVKRSHVKKIRTHAKDGAQERIGRHLGAFRQDNEQLNPIVRMLDLLPPEALATMEELLRGSLGDAGGNGGEAATGSTAPAARSGK